MRKKEEAKKKKRESVPLLDCGWKGLGMYLDMGR